MQNNPQPQKPRQGPEKPRRQRMRLPFEPRQTDAGEWSYDHRRGICITLILYLLIAIGFMWGKIDLGAKPGAGTILVEFPEEKPQARLTPEQIKALEASMRDDFSDVRNRASNENADLNDNLRDAKGTDASKLYEDAGALSDKMAANRQAYEDGLRKVEQMQARTGSQGSETTAQDSKAKGRVTVSFSFTDPVRSSRKLVIPAYKCEGGGEVVVNATLDHNGNVTSATVERSLSSSDHCMQTTAVNSALASRFNMDTSAPAKHRGTITYIFIPQ